MKRSARKPFASVLFFAGILLSLGLFSGCGEKKPEIVSIDPRVGLAGDLLTIRGSGFGAERDESYVSIAGTSPTGAYYLSWSDSEISLRIPEFASAGLVYVHRRAEKSNPLMFVNRLTIPLSSDPSTENGPRITSIEPSSGAVGSLVTIQGSSFGSSREGSGVFFAWNSDSPEESSRGGFVEADETEFGYELWSEREIRVRVPDGAVSGNLEVRSSRGTSSPVFFEISGGPGTKTYRDKQTYIFSLAADMLIEAASIPNSLYIWMPQPAFSASQRNVELLSRNTEPFIENYRGASLFQLVDTAGGSNPGVLLSYTADVYAVETSIRNQAPPRLNNASPVGTVYTLSTPLIPSDSPEIKAKAAEIAGRERFPGAKARRIYDWLLASVNIGNSPLSGGAAEALASENADSYQASLLFCALARASGIPALPVAGVLIDGRRHSAAHYWAEFWIDGLGWVPVDPALGAGAAPSGFELREDSSGYYFGNVDNRRIVFSRGERFLSQISPSGRTVSRERAYSLQNLWEEAIGGLDSYSSVWSDVTITEIKD